MDEKWTFSALKNTMLFSLGGAMLSNVRVVFFFFFSSLHFLSGGVELGYAGQEGLRCTHLVGE